MDKAIQHHPNEQRFTVATGGEPAVLAYELRKPARAGELMTVDFTSTYVPSAYRSQGIAEALVRHGLGWAREQGYHIQASCWYVAKFLRH